MRCGRSTRPFCSGSELRASAAPSAAEDMCNFLEGMLQKDAMLPCSSLRLTPTACRMQDPSKRFSIIECINHTWFEKMRHSHLEDERAFT